MALYNEILTGKLNRWLQKILQMKGGPPSAQLAGDITPQISIPAFGVETFVHLGWYRYAKFVSAPAVAAQDSNVRLRNPLNSGIVAVIEKIMVANTNAGESFELDFAQVNNDLATPISSNAVPSLDGRNGRGTALILSLGGVTQTIGAEIEQINIGVGVADFILTENQEIVLSPGDAIQVQGLLVNTLLSVSFVWRERFLEESELKT